MSLGNYGRACMLPSRDPLPFIRLPKSGGLSESIWHWVKSAVDVSSSALYRLTIRIRSDDTICPNTNTLFGPLFGTEANIRYIPSWDLYSQIGKQLACWRVHWAQGFDRNGRKEVIASYAGAFFLFAISGKLHCSTCLAGEPSDVWFCQRAYEHQSQHKDLPLCHGTRVRPSGLFLSVRNSLVGSFVTGVPAEAKHQATKSLRAWYLADLPGALLQTKLLSPRASTGEPHWHWCGMQRSMPSLKLTPTLTASSSNLLIFLFYPR